MKKLLVVLMVLAFAVPAMAADNFSIKGEYYVTGWSTENFGDLDSDNKGDDTAFWFQRMRLQPQIKAADGVTANLRIDLAETTWGGEEMQAIRPGVSSTGGIVDGDDPANGKDVDDPVVNKVNVTNVIQVDRAYVDVNKGIWRLRAGLQFFGVGQNQVFRDNTTGLQFNLKTPVSLRLGYIKRDENIGEADGSSKGVSDEDDLDTQDKDIYLLDVGFKNDKFAINAFYVMESDDKDVKDEKNVIGVYVRSKIGPVAVKGEIASFGGTKEGATDVDYTGIQLNIDAMLKISDMVSVAGELIYSDGEDKADEDKIALMGNPFARKSLITGGGMFGDYYSGNWSGSTGVGGTPLGSFGVFDPGSGQAKDGTNTGATGLGLGVKITPMEKLAITAYLHYLTATEEIDGAFESALIYQGVVSYMIAPKTSLNAAYLGGTLDVKDVDDVDAPSSMWLNLKVAF